MKGHTLPGPYQKKGDPVPEKMKKIQPEPLVSPAEHAKNAKGYHKDVAYHPGGYGKMGSLSKPSGWTASGKVSTKSGHRRKDIAASASTVDKRFSTAKDKKSLKRPLKKKGDPKKGRNYSKNVIDAVVDDVAPPDMNWKQKQALDRGIRKPMTKDQSKISKEDKEFNKKAVGLASKYSGAPSYMTKVMAPKSVKSKVKKKKLKS